MKRILAAAGVAALIVACESGTGGRILLTYDGGSFTLPPGSSDGGDAGSDGGTDGGDGGADAGDGGCTHQSFNGTAYDNCFGTGPVAASMIESSCGVSLYLSQGTILCTGTLSGTADAFDGGCQGPSGNISCSSTSLPGTLTCDGGTSTCSIVICNAGTCP